MPDFTPIASLLGSLVPPGTPVETAPSAPSAAGPALATGLAPLDALTGGWRPGELVLVTGGPGAGKSALLFGQALHAARTGTVALAPLKHTARVALWRLAAPVADVPIASLMRGGLPDEEVTRVSAAVTEIGRLPLHLLDAADPVLEDVAEQARRLHRARGLALLAVDGLHALGLRAEEAEPVTRERRLVEVALGLAALASELNVPVLVSIFSEPLADRLPALAARVLRIGPADPATGRVTLGLRAGAAGEERTADVRFAADRLRFEAIAP